MNAPIQNDRPLPEELDHPPTVPKPPVIVFDDVAQGGNEVLIDHNDQVYRLRLTRNGKLILNK